MNCCLSGQTFENLRTHVDVQDVEALDDAVDQVLQERALVLEFLQFNRSLPYDLDEMAALLQSVEVHHRFRNELSFFHTRSASDLRRGSKRRNSAQDSTGMRSPATVAFFRKLLYRAGPRPYAIGERIYRFLRNRF